MEASRGWRASTAERNPSIEPWLSTNASRIRNFCSPLGEKGEQESGQGRENGREREGRVAQRELGVRRAGASRGEEKRVDEREREDREVEKVTAGRERKGGGNSPAERSTPAMRRNGGMGRRETRKGLTSFRSLLPLSLALSPSLSLSLSLLRLSFAASLSRPAPLFLFALHLCTELSFSFPPALLAQEDSSTALLRTVSLLFPGSAIYYSSAGENLYTSYPVAVILNSRFTIPRLSPFFFDGVACLMLDTARISCSLIRGDAIGETLFSRTRHPSSVLSSVFIRVRGFAVS